MTKIEKTLERIEAFLKMNVSEVMNVKEAAIFLSKSESRIRHLVADREIPHYRNDRGQISFKKSELEAWRLGKPVETNAQINSNAATYLALKRL